MTNTEINEVIRFGSLEEEDFIPLGEIVLDHGNGTSDSPGGLWNSYPISECPLCQEVSDNDDPSGIVRRVRFGLYPIDEIPECD